MTNYERVDELKGQLDHAWLEGDKKTFSRINAELDRQVKSGFVDSTLLERDEGLIVNDIVINELAGIGELLNRGEYAPHDAYLNLIDAYWSWQNSLDDEAKQVLKELIFGYAKDSGIDFRDALDIWKEQEALEQAK